MSFLDWLWRKSQDYGLTSAAPPPFTPELAAAMPAGPVPSVYSVEMAIELMRTLPLEEDADLVLRVVRKTLRSTGVSVEDIITSARSRETACATRAAQDHAAIQQLEHEITARRMSIERIELEIVETRNVRDRLEHAIEEETKVVLSLPADEVAQLQADAEARLHAETPARVEVYGATATGPTPAAPLTPPAAPPTPAAPHAAFPPFGDPKAEPHTSLRSQAPAVPRTMPPLPKTGAPPLPKKSMPPKAPLASIPPKSSRPDAPTPGSEGIARPRGNAVDDAVTKD